MGIGLAQRAFETRSGDAPITTIASVMADYLRLDPSSTAPWSAEDYAHMMRQIAEWLLDPAKGMEQLYDLTELRKKD